MQFQSSRIRFKVYRNSVTKNKFKLSCQAIKALYFKKKWFALSLFGQFIMTLIKFFFFLNFVRREYFIFHFISPPTCRLVLDDYFLKYSLCVMSVRLIYGSWSSRSLPNLQSLFSNLFDINDPTLDWPATASEAEQTEKCQRLDVV